MPNGNSFRRDQRQQQRTQTRFANMQLQDYRRATQLDRMAAERRRRAAEAEAERRRREAQQRAEAEARRLREQVLQQRRQRREQEKLQRRATRQQTEVLAQQQEAQRLQLLRQNELAQRLAEQQAELQYQQDTAALALLIASLGPLRIRANAVHPRTTALIHVLLGSGVAELAQLQADAIALPQIANRCQANLALAQAQLNGIREALSHLKADLTRAAIVLLTPAITACAADDGTVTAADALATLAENNYQADRNLIVLYPNLGLTRVVIHDVEGPTHKLSGAELTTLNTKLAGHRVLTWVRARLPQSRPHRSGERMLVPQTLNLFPYQPSPEVFHDWVWGRVQGHGQPAATMMNTLRPISQNGNILGVAFTWAPGQNGRHVITHDNVILRVVLDPAQVVLITFFRTQ